MNSGFVIPVFWLVGLRSPAGMTEKSFLGWYCCKGLLLFSIKPHCLLIWFLYGPI